jgi:large subunit ribosomal protein L25
MNKMEKIELMAAKRTASGKKNKLLRTAGKVPAVVYGRGVAAEPLELEAKVIEKVYRTAGGNKIVSLKVGEGRSRNVLIHDVQYGRAHGELTHVDFYVVRMDELLKTEIPLHFSGESNAVYQDEGTLVKNLEMIEVECLPGDLPESVEVDISVLDDFEKTITLADLKIPEGVKLVEEDLEVIVAKVDPPRTDAEMEALDEAVEGGVPASAQEENPIVVSEENEGDKDRRDKK